MPCLLVIFILVISSNASAQSFEYGTVTENAPIYVKPEVLQTPLRVAAPGTRLKILERQEQWLQVEFHDPVWGRRVGFVQRKFVRDEALNPMDLSVPERPATPGKPPAAVPPAVPREPVTPPQQQSRPRPAPVPAASDESRVWIDVNLGFAFPGEKTVTTEGTYLYFGETATERATYDFGTGASFDFGGGVMITETFGLGVNFQGTAHQDPVTLYANIPHPRFRNAFASDTAESVDKLERTEGSVNIQAVFRNNPDDHSSIRVFGGPSYFRLKADAVGEVVWDQVYGLFNTSNTIDITGWRGGEVDESGWGFHVGADYSYFFSNVVGVGVMGRYSYGKVTFLAQDNPSPIPNEDIKVQTGGFQTGGGLRLRF